MTLIAIGINHKTAPVELREKVAFPPENMVDALTALRQSTGVEESVILSTCNRTELYVNAGNVNYRQVQDWLAAYHGVDAEQLRQYSYCYNTEQAVAHIMRVASGLDSLILGEPQILGQIKQAFSCAKNSGAINSEFERLFQHTFQVAKRVRTETEIGANAVSVAFAAVQLSKQIFSALHKTRVLLIGAGETIELVARHLKDNDVQHMTVANRTLSRAQELAAQVDAKVITLSQIPAHLGQADIVISSTASTLPILGKGMVESALKERKRKPIFFVDLAVPRDIEAEVAELDDAYLYTVDDLQQIVEDNLASRQQAAEQAEQIVQGQTKAFLTWQQSQGAIDTLKLFREQNYQLKSRLQERALNQLAEGKKPEDVVIELANKLTNALLHSPTKAISHAAKEQDEERLSLIKQTLGLHPEQD